MRKIRLLLVSADTDSESLTDYEEAEVYKTLLISDYCLIVNF